MKKKMGMFQPVILPLGMEEEFHFHWNTMSIMIICPQTCLRRSRPVIGTYIKGGGLVSSALTVPNVSYYDQHVMFYHQVIRIFGLKSFLVTINL